MPTLRRWTEDQISNLKNLGQKHPAAQSVAQLDRSPSGTAVKAHELKVGRGELIAFVAEAVDAPDCADLYIAGGVREESHRNMPWKGLFHDVAEPGSAR